MVGSLLFPGNTLSQQTFREAVWKLEQALQLLPSHRPQTLLRVDGDFGTDDNLEWALHQGYDVCAKGFSGKRAGAWGKKVSQWVELAPDQRWAALAPEQLAFSRPTRTIAVRWRDKDQSFKHALYIVTDLVTPIPEVCALYSLRGGAEVDIRNDKQGLLLTHRRKRLWNAQQAIVWLDDLAHNWLIAFRQVALKKTALQDYGVYRLIQEVLNIPGEAVIEDGQLRELRLLTTHPHAEVMLDALNRFW